MNQVVDHLRSKQIHVIGPSGTEGSAVIDFLLGHGITSLTAHDLAATPEAFDAAFLRTHQWLDPEAKRRALAGLRAAPIALRYRDRYLEGIERADLIVVPQSWFRYAENAALRGLQAEGVPFTSMMRLFFETCPCPIIGVTGTNGKFTVAMLVYEMLRAAGAAAFVSGNDRTHVPMLYFLDAITPEAWLVLEISNRQLVGLPYSPHVGVITNVAGHHLDDHGSMEAYVEVKANLIRHQKPEDHAVLNLDNTWTRAMGGVTRATVWWCSAIERVDRGAEVHGGWLRTVDGNAVQEVLRVRDLTIPGTAMVENALAACAAAARAGVGPQAMAGVLRTFRGFPYRFSHVGEMGGIGFYEDSLATNPAAAAAAIRGLDRAFVLIAGGWRPAATPDDFQPMAEALQASGLCKGVLLIGTAAPVIAEALDRLDPADRPRIVRAGTLEGAMAEAERLVTEGDAVLLSPGCESFDQFADYRERGDRFRALAARWPGTAEEFESRSANID